MKVTASALLLAAVAVPGQAHPVQTPNDYENGKCVSLRQAHDAFAQALKKVNGDELTSRWLNAQVAHIEQETKALSCPIGADLFKPLQCREAIAGCAELFNERGILWKSVKGSAVNSNDRNIGWQENISRFCQLE